MKKLLTLLIPVMLLCMGAFAQISGPTTMCTGSTVTVHDSVSGGVWSISPTTVATISSGGVVTSVSAGTATVTYLVGTAISTHTITVSAGPGPISGTSTVCAGATTALTDATPGGVWSSSAATIASVASGTGVVSGVAAGTTTISYTLTSGCSSTFAVTVGGSGSSVAIYGDSTMCVGTSATFTTSAPGGVWTSSASGIATVGSSSGIVTPVSAGSVAISYSVTSSCGSGTAVYYVMTFGAPAAISGPSTLCSGVTTTFSDATTGGTWATGSTSIAPITAAGVVTGGTSGTTTIYYYGPGGCMVSHALTVGGSGSAGTISGDSTMCSGGTFTFSSTVTGGTWTSSNPAVATVGTGGLVTAVSAGSVIISYAVATSCGTAYATYAVWVTTSTTTAGTITGATTVAAGSTIALADPVPGGTWSSSNPTVATVSGATGIVTGVAAGTVTISYTIMSCGGPISATYTITVTPGAAVNRVSGHVHFSGPAVDSTAPVKVWLITYNSATTMLEAVDSVTLTASTSTYYQFLTAVTDSYRVKAAYFPTTFSSTGYVPTYHTNGYHWNTATVFYHTSGTADDNKDITMNYGTVTTGPGFIGGSVTSGADRGTAGTVPVANMLVLLVNNTSGALMQQAYTNAAGAYSFSNLTVGTNYTVYPEDINYVTTALTPVSLTTASPSFSGANFVQHTVSHTITPIALQVVNVTKTSSVAVFPNPANDKLTIQVAGSNAAQATVVLTDVTGVVVYKANMDVVNGNSTIEMTNMPTGTYIISVKAADINYVNKVQVAH